MNTGNKKIVVALSTIFVIGAILVFVAVNFMKKPDTKLPPGHQPISSLYPKKYNSIPVTEKFCNEKNDEKEKEKCFDEVRMRNAVDKENIKDCLNIKTIEKRDDCVKTLAAYRTLRKDDFCFAVSDLAKRGLCIDKIAFTSLDVNVCEKNFENEPFEFQECVDRISAFKIGENEKKTGEYDIYNCKNIKSLEYPRLCMIKSFKYKFNDDCGNIPVEFKSYCASYYSVLNAKTLEECSDIPMENYKKFCVAKVNAGGWGGVADLDSDNDGSNDWGELFMGTDPYNSDTDGDGLLDGEEVNSAGTNPAEKDTDGDGLFDADEKKYSTDPNNPDTNGNGISDGEEVKKGTNPTLGDSDKDGLFDADEKKYSTDPNNPDTNGNGISDGEEVKRGLDPIKKGENVLADTDKDGLADLDEIIYGTNPFKKDTDTDGISDKEEVDNLTNPMGIGGMDFDRDGLNDKSEKIYETNPILADTDGDGLDDYKEILEFKTNPLKTDTDGDGYKDGDEVRKGFNPLEKGK